MNTQGIENDNVSKEMNNGEIKIVYIYRKYPSQKKAIKTYQEKHKDEIREYSKKYQKDRYINDEEYREKRKQKSLERYYLKKQETPNLIVV
jgi:nucleosome binding factor SPN SPT16 subunit